MDAFETALTRAFAESHDEPADAGFTVNVAKTVAWRERLVQIRQLTQAVGMAAAGAAAVYGGVQLFQAQGNELMASFGLELARAHGAMAQASITTLLSEGLLTIAAIGGGVFAFRQARN